MGFKRSTAEKAREFWKWFSKNNAKYLFLSEMDAVKKDEVVNELLARLHKFNKHLFFEIGGHPDDDHVELIITAEGVEDFFPSVEDLVDAAPDIPRWKVVKFRQPHPGEFQLDYAGKTFDPAKIIFITLYSKEEPNGFGIRVCYDDLTEENKDVYTNGTFILLDGVLGERSAVEDIDYIDLVKTPDDITEEFFPTLQMLPQLIRERKVFKYPGERFSVIENLDSEGYLTFVTANLAYKNFSFKEEFPHFLKIQIATEDYDENGHPTDEESEVLNSFEDFLDEKIKESTIAHYIGRTTRYKSRELLYYIDQPAKVKALLEVIREDSDPIRRFQYNCVMDRLWENVSSILDQPDDQIDALPGK